MNTDPITVGTEVTFTTHSGRVIAGTVERARLVTSGRHAGVQSLPIRYYRNGHPWLAYKRSDEVKVGDR